MIFLFFLGLQKLVHRQEMVEKSTLSPQDKEKISALLQLENAVEFMSSEESEEGEAEENIEWPTRKAHQTTSVREN